MAQLNPNERSDFVIGADPAAAPESEMPAEPAYIDPRHRAPHENFVVWGNSSRIGRLLDASINEIYLFDARSLNFQQVSGGALRNLGYSMSGMSRMTPMDLQPLNRGQFESMLAPLRRGEFDQLIYESTHRRRDGSIYPVEVRLQLAASESPPVFIAVVQDLTERQRAAESLRQSEKRFHATFEQAAVGIAHVALSGRFLEINKRLCEILDYSNEALTKLRHTELVHAEDLEVDADKMTALMRRDIETFATEKRLRKADGNYIWARLTISLAFGDRGEPDYFIFVVEDISERKRFEHEIRILNEKLEQRVLERTGELSAVNRELEAFSYSVSHDLRAPLRSIDGFSQALLEDHGERLDATGRSLLERVRAASQRMAHLIDDLLSLSRITRSEMQRRKLNLSNLVREKLYEMREAGAAPRAEFVIEPNVEAYGDEGLLRIALSNLLDNAIKFSSKVPEPQIEFGTTLTPEGERVIFIRDNGAGFDMAYANKLFGAFQRLHSPDEFDGTGIGLVTVQRIIHRHAGRIWAEGEVDRGATFYLKLPDGSEE